MVEVPVYAEHAFVQIQHTFLLKVAVSLFLRQNEVERLALLKPVDLFLKLVERYSEASYELERLTATLSRNVC